MKVLLFLPFVCAAGLLAQTPAAPKAKPAPPKSSAKPSAAAPAKAKTATPATASASSAPAAASTSSPVVLTIGDVKMTAQDFDALLEGLPESSRAQAGPSMKRSIAEQVIRVKLLANEARKRSLDRDSGVQTRMALQADSVLAGAAFKDMLDKTKLDAAAIEKYYQEHKGEYEKVEARHILIKFKGSPVPQREGKPELTEEQALVKALEVRKRILGGEDFAKVAEAESDDTGSGGQGGSLGSFSRGQMVGPFEQAAFSLPVGQLSEPIKTQFGYHVIRVDKHETKSLDDVRSEIETKLRPETARQQVENLRKESKVVFDTNYFGPEQSAGAPPQGIPVQVTPAK